MRRWLLIPVLLSAAVVRAEDARPEEPSLPREEGDPFSIAGDHRLTLSVKHSFAKSEAMERLSYLFAYWKRRFNIVSLWRGDRVFLSGSVYGVKVEALFEINETGVTGFAQDPGWPWRSQIVSYVDSKLRKYLHPTYDEP